MQPQNNQPAMFPQDPTAAAPPPPPPAPVVYPKTHSVLSIILSILVVIVIATGAFVGGIFTAKGSQKAVDQKTINSLQNQIVQLKKTYSGVPVDDIPGVKYLTIKEWNIRLQLDKSYQDVSYKYRQRSSGDFIEVYSPKLAAIGTCQDYDGEIGTIQRMPTGGIPTPTTNVVGLDDYLYMYQSYATVCTTNPNLEASYKASAIKQFATLEDTPTSERDTNSTDSNSTPDTSNSPDNSPTQTVN